MARRGLTIQQKLLLLILLVGFVPAAIGLGLTIWGSRLSFASAMGSTLQSRASEMAARVGFFGEQVHGQLLRAVQMYGGDVESIHREVSRTLRFNAAARADPDGTFEVIDFDPEKTDISAPIAERREHFMSYLRSGIVGPLGYVDDINLVEKGESRNTRLAVFMFRAGQGSLVYFFITGDDYIRQMRGRISGESEDLVFIYSRNGYMLSSAVVPPGLTERTGALFDENRMTAPGWFSARGRDENRNRWHVAGYSVIPRVQQASAAGITNAVWAVLVAYDMENFVGPQTEVVWGTVLAAAAWVLILVFISIVAARKVARPVKTLRHQAEAMAGGNLDARARVETHDEINDLADAFNTMADRLQETYRKLQAQVEANRLRAEHINVINEITKAVTQALDIDRTFEILRRDLKAALDYDGLWIALTDKETGKLTVKHAEPASMLKPLRRGDVPLEFSFHGRALREGLASSGAIGPSNDSDIFESGVYLGLGFASYLVAPLPSVGRILGTITVVSRRKDAYGEEETAVLASVAGAVALAIELTELFERTRAFATELEQKVAERTRDLNRANQKLIQTEKYAATGRLAANLAHEINNPLNIIKNYLRLVSDALQRAGGGRRATDPNMQHISIINEEIDRIARIVHQLLDLHRPSEQKVMRTDISALISDVCALVEKDFQQSNIALACTLQPDLPMPMVAPDLVRQVIINLIRNAQDAMDGKGGALSIKTESAMQFDGRDYQRVIIITIGDTGPGIAKEHLNRIFDPFFTTKPPDKGTGLGLAVSFGIIQMYHGSIEAFSEPGKGTTMVVTIPIDPPPMEREDATGANGQEADRLATLPTEPLPQSTSSAPNE